jgi:hypothetical protein
MDSDLELDLTPETDYLVSRTKIRLQNDLRG